MDSSRIEPKPGTPIRVHLSSEATGRVRVMRSETTDETFGAVTELGADRLRHLRVQHETLAPGKRSSLPHYHTHREECVLVLSGEVTVVVGDERFLATDHDFICFPAGPPAHSLHNASESVVSLLVFSASPSDDQVVFERADAHPDGPTRE